MIKDAHKRLKERMIEQQLISRGISDPLVLEAFQKINRHNFVNEALAQQSYSDSALPIQSAQTISQPFIVAKMTESLKLVGNEKVLEIGTGSGFQTCILASLGCKVYTIERHANLLLAARELFKEYGFDIESMIGDGSIGWSTEAPFDRIIVTAASPEIPNSLINQLRVGGLMVIPVGDQNKQILFLVTKTEQAYDKKELVNCKFVPLIGREGFSK